MDFSKLYKGLMELGNIYQKIDNVEIQKKLLDLSQEALEMQNEILILKEENAKLKQKQNIEFKIERHKDAYITLKDDEQKLIYCSNCYDTKRQLVQAQINDDGQYLCPACKYLGYYNKERYKALYEIDYNNDII